MPEQISDDKIDRKLPRRGGHGGRVGDERLGSRGGRRGSWKIVILLHSPLPGVYNQPVAPVTMPSRPSSWIVPTSLWVDAGLYPPGKITQGGMMRVGPILSAGPLLIQRMEFVGRRKLVEAPGWVLAEDRDPILWSIAVPVSYTHLRAHETVLDLVC